MPHRSYLPRHKPATWWERVLMHPMENGVAVLAGYMGITNVIRVISALEDPTRLPGLYPSWLLLIIAALNISGAIYALVALHWKLLSDVGRSWAMERMGWSLIIASAGAYSVTVWYFFPEGTGNIPFRVIIAIAAGVRVISLFMIEKRVRAVQRKLGDTPL